MIPDETPSFAARCIRFAAGIMLLITIILPLAAIIQFVSAKVEAEREWQETVRRENAKTEKAIKSFQEAVKRAKAGRP
jgi:hypothetical protein